MKVGTRFWINSKRYGMKEVLTVTETDDTTIYCESSRFPGQLQIIPRVAIEAYGDRIQLFENWERDYKRATRIIETGIVGTVAADWTDENKVAA